MDRVEFTQTITCEKITFDQVIKEYFDQLLALYDLVGSLSSEEADICAESYNDKDIKFIILMESEKDVTELYNILRDQRISLYGREFTVNLTKNSKNSSLQVILNEDKGK